MSMRVENLDIGSALLQNASYQDELLTFTDAGTIKAGTILARDSSTKSLVVYVKGGTTNDNGIPKFILTYDVTADGAGDESIRAATKGEYNLGRLIIAADGDASNIDKDVLDQLRLYGFIALPVTELNILDNQPTP